MAQLQLALDLLDQKLALQIARKTKKYVDIVEAGTPLIKQNGLQIVSKLKKTFPEKTILADLKTADTGALEVQMAKDAGADITTILGVASPETLRKGIRHAKKIGIKVMVDTIGSTPSVVLKKLVRCKPHYLAVHRAIDKDKGAYGIDKINTKIHLAVAGGINERTAKKLADKAEVIIVGRAITAAEDPKEAAKKIKEVIE